MLDSWMPPRRRSLGSRSCSGPLLALWASCLWGCPQLLSDDFGTLGGSPDLSEDPPVLDSNGTGGTSGSSGSSGTGGSSGSAGTAGSSSGSGGTGGTPVSVVGAPSVVSVFPNDDASGVAADAVVTVTFSEPMDIGSVQDAYSSTDLPASSVTFTWSAGDTVLQIAPNQPLTLAAGTDPGAVTPRSYSFEISAAAQDPAGDALPRFSSSFTTLRRITQTLLALEDRTLTGNWRSDDIRGNNSCEELESTAYTTCIGDSSNDNAIYRGFVTFDLPAQIQDVTAAQLGMEIHTIRGTPFAALGTLLAERVSFDSINLIAFDSAALGSPINVSTSASEGAQLSVSVLSSVQDDLAVRQRSQFRFRFSDLTDSNLAGDLIETSSNTQTLELTYLTP